MANKRDKKLKQQRHSERLDKKQIHKAATVAAQHSFAIAMYAVKTVFKERASNPKMEEFIVKMLTIWEKIGKGEDGIVYDCLKNLTGYPVLKINAPGGESVKVIFSEELLPDGRIDMEHWQGQECTIVSDGKGRCVQPDFTWYGFRCFEVIGDAEVKEVKFIHSDVKVNSTFDCSNETLNWTYNTFVHTMLCNMHTGHPSDCPHLERRG